MLKVGDTLELEIHDLAFGGQGVARRGQFVVFVPFAIPSERVRARIWSVKKNFATAQLLEVLAASPHRVKPTCAHFGQTAQPLPCGGCQLQHIEYSQQLAYKTAQIRETLRRIGGIENPPLEKMIPSPRPYAYRNRITLHRRGNRIGFFASDNQTLLDIEQCPLADDSINAALAQIRRKSDLLHKPCRPDGDVCIRHASGGAVSWFEPARGKAAQPLKWIEETVMGRQLKLPAASFFQVNAALTPTMVRLAQAMFAAGKCRTVVDAYCGVGLFTLFLAQSADRAYGIESDGAAVQAARFNAETLGLKNCEFARGNVGALLPKILATLDAAATCVLLDPPRAGCEPPVIEALRQIRPKQIIYISCNPPALARDLKKLLAPSVAAGAARQAAAAHFGGYKLSRVVPLDMFPQTAHCEVIAQLHLVEKLQAT